MPDVSIDLDDASFRMATREWLTDHLAGPFAELRGRGWPGDGDAGFEGRAEWERLLGRSGWIGLGWPITHGGRGASIGQQIIFAEEYATAEAPGRVNHMGEHLLGPTLIEFGTPAQQQRFLPPILDGSELWCQGYSEPDAGSDLANVATRAVLDGGEWVIDGQKVWTSYAQHAQWIFVIARTEPGSQRHHGLSFLLVPMDQPGVEVRPIRQLTGGAEFNEVFLDGARTASDLVVGDPGDGWRVAMGLLGFERGASTLADQVGYARELDALVAMAKDNGSYDDPLVRDRLARATVGLEVMGLNAVRGLAAVTAGEGSASGGGAASISKLVWANWHRDLGELAMEIAGRDALTTGPEYEIDSWQRLYLYSRADTIYGGSDEVQRNILAERVLGLPKEPRG